MSLIYAKSRQSTEKNCGFRMKHLGLEKERSVSRFLEAAVLAGEGGHTHRLAFGKLRQTSVARVAAQVAARRCHKVQIGQCWSFSVSIMRKSWWILTPCSCVVATMIAIEQRREGEGQQSVSLRRLVFDGGSVLTCESNPLRHQDSCPDHSGNRSSRYSAAEYH